MHNDIRFDSGKLNLAACGMKAGDGRGGMACKGTEG